VSPTPQASANCSARTGPAFTSGSLMTDVSFGNRMKHRSLIAFLQMLNRIAAQHPPDIYITTVVIVVRPGLITWISPSPSVWMICTDVPDVRLKITTYQKPHHQYMYIPYHSFHRRGVFKGFIKAELQQCYSVIYICCYQATPCEQIFCT
jgi:hypothetical protein